MASEYFDDMHKKVGADKLNEEERKKLYGKFVDGGGEVVKAPKKEKEADSKLKSKSKSSSASATSGRGGRTSHADSEKSKKGKKGKSSAKHLGSESSFFDRLSLYLNALVSGVVTITGKRYKSKFISMIKTDLEKELANLVSVVNFLLNPKKGNLKLLKGMLIQQDVYLYELLRLVPQIYQPADFETLGKKTSTYPSDIDFIVVEEPIKNLYKKLYLFRPYTLRIREAIRYGLDVHRDYNKLSQNDEDILLNKANKAIKFIFDEAFLKFHYAYCKLLNDNIFIQNQDKLDELLSISDKEKVDYLIQTAVGKREKSSPGEKTQKTDGYASEEETQEEEEEKFELPSELEEGKKWIAELNYSRSKALEKDPKFYLEDNEKMLQVFVILEEFEKEFSFILTSNKISFNVDFFQGKKFDTKKELSDLYLGINACHDGMKDYIDIKKNIYQTKDDSVLTPGQKTQKLDKLAINQNRIGNITRTRLLDIARTLEKIMTWITEKGKDVVQNADEKLHFDTLDGKKKVENKNAIEAIGSCASFIGYLKYLLEAGELAGTSPNILK